LSFLSAGRVVHDHGDSRFAVIEYVYIHEVTLGSNGHSYSEGKFVYSARRHDYATSSYICQLPQQGLFKL